MKSRLCIVPINRASVSERDAGYNAHKPQAPFQPISLILASMRHHGSKRNASGVPLVLFDSVRCAKRGVNKDNREKILRYFRVKTASIYAYSYRSGGNFLLKVFSRLNR